MKTGAVLQDSRIIAAEEWRGARWGWMESVRRDGTLSMTARVVADSLALDFVNVRTMRCDPSHRELAELLGCSQDTIKRAIRELVAAGWITRQGGIGRSVKSSYGFLTKAQVISIKGGRYAPPKRGQKCPDKGAGAPPFSASQKGADLHGKGGKSAPAHNNAEPWKNHGARPHAGLHARAPHAREAGSTAPKLSTNPVVHKTAADAVKAWRDGRASAFDDLQHFVIDHILAAGLLTEGEVIRAFPDRAEKGGA